MLDQSLKLLLSLKKDDDNKNDDGSRGNADDGDVSED